MTDTKDKKSIWRRHWLTSLLSLADISLQKEKWLDRGAANPHWSYVEFMCSYFDDSLVEDYQALINKGWITKEEYECIKDYHHSLEQYEAPNDDSDPQSILA